MLQVCWSPKGGSGTSVVAAAIALQAASAGHDTLLVDLAGDQSAVCGVESGEGVGDWFAAEADVGPEALRSLEVEIGERLRLLRRGGSPESRWSPERVALAMALFDRSPGLVVVDGGRQTGEGLPARADARVVLIEEPGRALSRRDVEAAIGTVAVVLPWDPAVARAVDAGLLVSRMPRSLRPLRRLAPVARRVDA